MTPARFRSFVASAVHAALLLLIFAMPFLSAAPDTASAQALLDRARQADASLRNAESLRLLLQAEQVDPKNSEILALIAKQYSQLAADAHASGDRKSEQLLSDCALGYAVRAVTASPGSPLAHASLAICYARSSLLEGARKKIEYSKLVRSEAEKAVLLDPNQDVALHVLGAWNYNMVELNPFLKKVVEVIYGRFPEASLPASAAYLQRAAKAAPTRLMHQAALAKTYAAMGDKENARRALAAAEALPVKEKEDAGLLKEARQAVAGM